MAGSQPKSAAINICVREQTARWRSMLFLRSKARIRRPRCPRGFPTASSTVLVKFPGRYAERRQMAVIKAGGKRCLARHCGPPGAIEAKVVRCSGRPHKVFPELTLWRTALLGRRQVSGGDVLGRRRVHERLAHQLVYPGALSIAGGHRLAGRVETQRAVQSQI